MAQIICINFQLKMANNDVSTDGLNLPQGVTDNFERGSFICGNLKKLGWAVYRGCSFEKEKIHHLCRIRQWENINSDVNRKYCVVDESKKAHEATCKHFKPIMVDVVQCCLDIIDDKDDEYECKKWSIFKNELSSPHGQALHTDYPRIHDETHTNTRKRR